MKLRCELPAWLPLAVAACPAAGSGVHRWLFSIARQLWPHHDRAGVIAIISAATANCGRDVSESEISEAVDAAEPHQWQPQKCGGMFAPKPKRKAAWPELNATARQAITAGAGLADLWEASPVRLDGNNRQTEEIIDLLFPGNPLLCVGDPYTKPNGSLGYTFDTKPRESWRGALVGHSLLVPSPMSAVWGRTKKGKLSKHTLSNTGPRRFLVCEFDEGTADEHAALLLHFATLAPLVLAVHSGSKSLHGWFYCAGHAEEKLRRFMEYAVSLGADQATWTPSQFVRCPDGTRRSDTNPNGTRQTVYYLNPQPLEVSQ